LKFFQITNIFGVKSEQGSKLFEFFSLYRFLDLRIFPKILYFFFPSFFFIFQKKKLNKKIKKDFSCPFIICKVRMVKVFHTELLKKSIKFFLFFPIERTRFSESTISNPESKMGSSIKALAFNIIRIALFNYIVSKKIISELL